MGIEASETIGSLNQQRSVPPTTLFRTVLTKVRDIFHLPDTNLSNLTNPETEASRLLGEIDNVCRGYKACRDYGVTISLVGEPPESSILSHAIRLISTPGAQRYEYIQRGSHEQKASGCKIGEYIVVYLDQTLDIGAISQKKEYISFRRSILHAISEYESAFSVHEANRAHIERLTQAVQDNLRRVYTDKLTGLSNRAGFDNFIQVLIGKIREGAITGSLALCMLDLDKFKQINDSLGHGFGDKFLQTFSYSVNGYLDSLSDTYPGLKYELIRYGGEEFVLVLMNVTPEQIKEIGEGTRQFVSTIKYYPNSKEWGDLISKDMQRFKASSRDQNNQPQSPSLRGRDETGNYVGGTVSMGCSIFPADVLISTPDTIKFGVSFAMTKADAELYEAKEVRNEFRFTHIDFSTEPDSPFMSYVNESRGEGEGIVLEIDIDE